MSTKMLILKECEDDFKSFDSIYINNNLDIPRLSSNDKRNANASANKDTNLIELQASAVDRTASRRAAMFALSSNHFAGSGLHDGNGNEPLMAARSYQASSSDYPSNHPEPNNPQSSPLPLSIENLRDRIERSVLGMVPDVIKFKDQFKEKVEKALLLLIGKETIAQL